jgi:dTDP-glucose 4,6-dehydratase
MGDASGGEEPCWPLTDGPGDFVQNNFTGILVRPEAARAYFATLDGARRQNFRFHHVSTDEVFGAQADEAPPFNERTRYDPRSPYSASKAVSDHLARAWWPTYELRVIVSNTANNYGPWAPPITSAHASRSGTSTW